MSSRFTEKHLLDVNNREEVDGFSIFLSALKPSERYHFVMCLAGLISENEVSSEIKQAVSILRNAGIIVKVLRYVGNNLRVQFYYSEKVGNFCSMNWSLLKNLSYLFFARQGIFILNVDREKKEVRECNFIRGLPKALTKIQVGRSEITKAIARSERVRLEQKQDGTSVHFCIENEIVSVSTNGSCTVSGKIGTELEIAAGMSVDELGMKVFAFYKAKYSELKAVSFNIELHQIGFSLVTIECPATFGINHVNLIFDNGQTFDSSFGCESTTSDSALQAGIDMLVELEEHLRTLGARVSYRFRKIVANDPTGEYLEYFNDVLEYLIRNFRAYWHDSFSNFDPSSCPTDLPRGGELIHTEEDVNKVVNIDQVRASIEGFIVVYRVALGENIIPFYLKCKTDLFRTISNLTYGVSSEISAEIKRCLGEWIANVSGDASPFTQEIVERLSGKIFEGIKNSLLSGAKKFTFPKDCTDPFKSFDTILLSDEQVVGKLKNVLTADEIPTEKLASMVAEVQKVVGLGRFNSSKFPNTYAFLSTLGLYSHKFKEIEGLLNLSPKLFKRFHGMLKSLVKHAKADTDAKLFTRCLAEIPEFFKNSENWKKKIDTRRAPNPVYSAPCAPKYVEIAKTFLEGIKNDLMEDQPIVFVDLDNTLLIVPNNSMMRYWYMTLDGRRLVKFNNRIWEEIKGLFPSAKFCLLTGAKISSEEALQLLPEDVRVHFSGAIAGAFDISPEDQKAVVLSTIASHVKNPLYIIDDSKRVLHAVSGLATTIPVFPHAEYGSTILSSQLRRLIVKTIGIPGSGKSTSIISVISALRKLSESDDLTQVAERLGMTSEDVKKLLQMLAGNVAHYNFDDISRQNKEEGGFDAESDALKNLVMRLLAGNGRPEDPVFALIDSLGKQCKQMRQNDVPPFCLNLIYLPSSFVDFCVRNGYDITKPIRGSSELLALFNQWLGEGENKSNWQQICGDLVDVRENADELSAPGSTITPEKYAANFDSIFKGVVASMRESLSKDLVMLVPIRVENLDEYCMNLLIELVDLYRQAPSISSTPVYTGVFFPPENVQDLLEGSDIPTPVAPHVTFAYKPSDYDPEHLVGPKISVTLRSLKMYIENGREHYWLDVEMPDGMTVKSGHPHITISSPNPTAIAGFIRDGRGETVKEFNGITIEGVLGALHC
jgi:hypothetical protein